MTSEQNTPENETLEADAILDTPPKQSPRRFHTPKPKGFKSLAPHEPPLGECDAKKTIPGRRRRLVPTDPHNYPGGTFALLLNHVQNGRWTEAGQVLGRPVTVNDEGFPILTRDERLTFLEALYFQNLSVKELATVFGVSRQTIYTDMQDLRKQWVAEDRIGDTVEEWCETKRHLKALAKQAQVAGQFKQAADILFRLSDIQLRLGILSRKEVTEKLLAPPSESYPTGEEIRELHSDIEELKRLAADDDNEPEDEEE